MVTHAINRFSSEMQLLSIVLIHHTHTVFKKNMNASKPFEHPPSGEKNV